MTAMRERRAPRAAAPPQSAASQTPADGAPREDALPLVELDYDPETDASPPPGARGPHPFDEPDGVGADVLPAVPGVTDDGRASPAEEPLASTARRRAGRTGDRRDRRSPTSPTSAGAAERGPEREVPPRQEPAAEQAVERGRGRAARPAPPLRRGPGRPSVPSWDDVMFGAKPRD